MENKDIQLSLEELEKISDYIMLDSRRYDNK